MFAEHDYLIATLFVANDDEIAARVRNRNSGFTNAERAVEWNRQIQRRPLLKGEFRIDNTHHEPTQTADAILRIACNEQKTD